MEGAHVRHLRWGKGLNDLFAIYNEPVPKPEVEFA